MKNGRNADAQTGGGTISSGQAPPSGKDILVLNAGSSSLKFAVFRLLPESARIASGTIERIGSSKPRMAWRNTHREATGLCGSVSDHATALEYLLSQLPEIAGAVEFAAVGHRVVHGGDRYVDPQTVDPAMLAELKRISDLDPEHLPTAIGLMEATCATFPNIPQVACFDTAFHAHMPRVARMLPIPRRYEGRGVRRYGFHGLSYGYLMQELERVAGVNAASGRVILAHLGNGASLAAVSGGQCVDTTMGFTPASGLMMGTRSGDLDPGLFPYLARTERMTAAAFDQMVNRESGLLGVSGTGSDMRDLLAGESTDHRAAEAIALYCYQARKWIGALAAALGGLETLVFSGGVGENAAVVRARICEGLEFVGIEIDLDRNRIHSPIVSREGCKTTVRVIPADEEQAIAMTVGTFVTHSQRR